MTGSARHTTTSSARSRTSPKRGRARADGLEARGRRPSAGAADRSIAPIASASADRGALRLAVVCAEPVDERRPRLRAGSRPRRRRASSTLASRPSMRATGGGGRPLREPRVAERAGPRHARAPVGDRRLDVVAGAPAPGAGRVSHRPPPPPAVRAPRAAARPAPRARRAPPPGVAPVATSVQIGWPAAMRSPGCGTSRMPRSSQRTLSPMTHVLGGEEHRLAGRAGGLAPRRRGSSPAHARRCAPNTPTPYAASTASSEAGRARVDLDRPRALAVPDEVDAEQPAQARTRAARREQIARACAQQRRALAGRQPRRHDVPAPAVAAHAERAAARRAAR